jgi:hypothetical protein
MQVIWARDPPAIISRANSAVGLPHKGKSSVIPVPFTILAHVIQEQIAESDAFHGSRRELYNIDRDLHEANNSINSQPKRAAAMQKRLLAWRQTLAR